MQTKKGPSTATFAVCHLWSEIVEAIQRELFGFYNLVWTGLP